MIGAGITVFSTMLSDRRKRKGDDRRQWDKEIRDLYLDVAACLRRYEALELRVVYQDETDMDGASPSFSESKRQKHGLHNKQVQPYMRSILEDLDRIVERAEIINNSDILTTIKSTHEQIDKMNRLAHDGIVLLSDKSKISDLREKLLAQPRKATRRD